MAGKGGGGGVEMITINKGLAGVIPDFIRQQEMESRWQRSLSLFRKLIWMYGAPPPSQPASDSVFLLFHPSLPEDKCSLALSTLLAN